MVSMDQLQMTPLACSAGKCLMIKKRDFNEGAQKELYELMIHPEVQSYVRHHVENFNAFLRLNEQLIQEELIGETISRIIHDEKDAVIGTISLYDINNNIGFLATWLGKPYQGKGYNQPAKRQFLMELFTETSINTILMCVRKTNEQSQRAIRKLPYVIEGQKKSWELFRQVNAHPDDYILYEIPKDLFIQQLRSHYLLAPQKKYPFVLS